MTALLVSANGIPGWYQFNPQLSVRRSIDGVASWEPIFTALNLPFLNEFVWEPVWPRLDEYLMRANLTQCAMPIVFEPVFARRQQERLAEQRRLEALRE
ncbi:MAG: hypothetical protein ACO3B4_09715 [Burkholderiaceae bacterium]